MLPPRRTLWQATLMVAALASVRCSLLLDTSSLGDSTGPSANDVTEEDASTDILADSAVVEASTVGADGRAAFPDGVSVWPENGHGYLVVSSLAPITWTAANAAAQARGGHLATITSADEGEFVLSLMAAHPEAFKGGYGPWLGGLQHPEGKEPDGGWRWVTGEPWSFTAWAPGEPNEGRAGEEFIDLYSEVIPRQATWSDVADDANAVVSYIVEFE